MKKPSNLNKNKEEKTEIGREKKSLFKEELGWKGTWLK